MNNHDKTVKRRITRSIARCPWIPAEREKRAKKVAGYVETEMQREKHPEQTATTIRDLQEQVQHLQEEVAEWKHEAQASIRSRLKRLITKS
jgi:predicted RNase H-like nuclease (RuvC/YqgF family)